VPIATAVVSRICASAGIVNTDNAAATTAIVKIRSVSCF
jgi:hypothetical protein